MKGDNGGGVLDADAAAAAELGRSHQNPLVLPFPQDVKCFISSCSRHPVGPQQHIICEQKPKRAAASPRMGIKAVVPPVSEHFHQKQALRRTEVLRFVLTCTEIEV